MEALHKFLDNPGLDSLTELVTHPVPYYILVCLGGGLVGFLFQFLFLYLSSPGVPVEKKKERDEKSTERRQHVLRSAGNVIQVPENSRSLTEVYASIVSNIERLDKEGGIVTRADAGLEDEEEDEEFDPEQLEDDLRNEAWVESYSRSKGGNASGPGAETLLKPTSVTPAFTVLTVGEAIAGVMPPGGWREKGLIYFLQDVGTEPLTSPKIGGNYALALSTTWVAGKLPSIGAPEHPFSPGMDHEQEMTAALTKAISACRESGLIKAFNTIEEAGKAAVELTKVLEKLFGEEKKN